MCRHLQEAFQDTFNDNPKQVRFNANSIRKFWERRWKKIKNSADISDGVNKAHLAQTAHGEKTAEDIYIGKEGSEKDREEILKIYDQDLFSTTQTESDDEEEAEAVDSDSEPEEESNETPLNNSVQESPFVRRFNLIRNSLNCSNSNTPMRQEEVTEETRQNRDTEQRVDQEIQNRTSLNSTRGGDNSDARAKYVKSLSTFRAKAGTAPWTEEEKKACMLFKDVRSTVSLADVKARCIECGINLSSASYFRIYNKVKAAVRILSEN